MKIVIMEDEIPAYEKLKLHIQNSIDDAIILGWGRSIQEGVELLKKHDPDLIFSDIELMDGLSFNIYDQVKLNCPIIFCTAFDQYLMRAFNTNGIAYLLKPYNEDNFQAAIEKHNRLFTQEATIPVPELISEFKTIFSNRTKQFKSRFSVKKKTGIKIISIEDVIYIQAAGDFSLIHLNDGSKHPVNYTLSSLNAQIDPDKFFQINRSEIVCIEAITDIQSHFKNRLIIQLITGDKLMTSGGRTPEFRQWIEG